LAVGKTWESLCAGRSISKTERTKMHEDGKKTLKKDGKKPKKQKNAAQLRAKCVKVQPLRPGRAGCSVGMRRKRQEATAPFLEPTAQQEGTEDPALWESLPEIGRQLRIRQHGGRAKERKRPSIKKKGRRKGKNTGKKKKAKITNRGLRGGRNNPLRGSLSPTNRRKDSTEKKRPQKNG